VTPRKIVCLGVRSRGREEGGDNVKINKDVEINGRKRGGGGGGDLQKKKKKPPNFPQKIKWSHPFNQLNLIIPYFDPHSVLKLQVGLW